MANVKLPADLLSRDYPLTSALADAEAQIKALTAENAALRLRLTTARVKLEAVATALGQA